ncbi:MAG: cytochrome P450 [Chloroflexota bacterium]
MSQTSTIPGARNLMGIQNIRQIQKTSLLGFAMDCWQTYDDLFFMQLGPGGLHFAAHPEMVRAISLSSDYSKVGSYAGVRQFLMGDGLITSVDKSWRRQRKTLSPFFTPRGITQYAEMMLDECNRLLESWGNFADTGEYLDIGDEMLGFAARIILQAIFSIEQTERIQQISKDVDTALAFVSTRHQSLIHLPLWWPNARIHRYNQAYARLQGFVNQLIVQRRDMPMDEWPRDILTTLLQTPLVADEEENEQVISNALIFDNCMTFFVAGHETTARNLAFTLYQLSQNPEAEAKLIAEVDDVLNGGPVTIDALKQMPYSLQVIKESLRLYPIAAYYPRDVIVDTTLQTSAGQTYTLSVGDTVMLFPYATHRHPDFWHAPDQFDPDRFTPDAESNRHPYAYAPFAAGQRVCIGNNFSLLESQLFLASMYQRFRVRLRPEHDPRIQAVATIQPTAGLPMRIERLKR